MFGIPTLGNIDSHWKRVFESSNLVSKRSAKFKALASLGSWDEWFLAYETWEIRTYQTIQKKQMLLFTHTHTYMYIYTWAKKIKQNLLWRGDSVFQRTFGKSRWPSIQSEDRKWSQGQKTAFSTTNINNEERHNSSPFAAWLRTTNNSKQLNSTTCNCCCVKCFASGTCDRLFLLPCLGKNPIIPSKKTTKTCSSRCWKLRVGHQVGMINSQTYFILRSDPVWECRADGYLIGDPWWFHGFLISQKVTLGEASEQKFSQNSHGKTEIISKTLFWRGSWN